jgi:hypothetical protein
MVSFVEMLDRHKAEAVARRADTDPWRRPLERLRGKVGDDGIERISTQAVFDLLEVPQGSRGSGASRRLATLMRELGWTPIKARGLNQAGFRDQIRGYAREQRRSPLS